MVVILSPAKTLDFKDQAGIMHISKPRFLDEAEQIMQKLKQLQKEELSTLMNISNDLADLNHTRHQAWEKQHCISNSKQAVYAFRGEVYNGLNIDGFSEDDILFAREHLRIISGLYGILRPMDIIQPYRLEMGARIQIGDNKNLYKFWNNKLAKQLNTDARTTGNKYLVNLASKEYFKALDNKGLKLQVVTPVFKELKNGQYKVITMYAKKARGIMAAWIMKNRINNAEEIKRFSEYGYMFDVNQSYGSNWVFTRG